ncbi:MAG: hypothetical protein AB4352_12670 [Hormoscilla sp.]
MIYSCRGDRTCFHRTPSWSQLAARSPPEEIAHRTTGVRRYIIFGCEPNVIDAVQLPMLLKMFNILYPNPTDARPIVRQFL